MSSYPTYYQEGMYTHGRPSLAPSPIFPQADIPTLLNTQQGVVINPVKTQVPAFYVSNSPFPSGITASGGIVSCGITPPRLQSDQGDMEITKLMSTSTGRFSVMLTDNFTNRNYMNKPVANNLVFGTSQLPFTLYETIFLPATNSLTALCTDLSLAANDIRIVMEGRRFTGAGCGGKAALQTPFISRRTHPYWLTSDTGPEVSIPANAVAQQVIMTVPTSADFLCWLVMDDSTVTAEDALTVRILEGNSGTILMDRSLSLRQFVAAPTLGAGANTGFSGGTARASGFPFSWLFTHLFPRGTQVIFEVTNTTASIQTLRVAMHGQLIYYGNCDVGMPDPERMRLLAQPYMPMPAAPNWLPCAPGQAPGNMVVPMMPHNARQQGYGQGQSGPTGQPYVTPHGEFAPGSTAMTGPRPYGNISGFGR